MRVRMTLIMFMLRTERHGAEALNLVMEQGSNQTQTT